MGTTPRTTTLTFAGGWQPGQELRLRRADANSNGFDSSVGIDDLFITTTTTTAVPEPATLPTFRPP